MLSWRLVFNSYYDTFALLIETKEWKMSEKWSPEGWRPRAWVRLSEVEEWEEEKKKVNFRFSRVI